MQVYVYPNFPFDESKKLKTFLKKIKTHNLNFYLLHYLLTLFAYTITNGASRSDSSVSICQ